ncbi:MAG: RNA-guided pseudouridylation complex pseudouridine synthase subunit Cbf5 [Nanoarchaeota archaeon]
MDIEKKHPRMYNHKGCENLQAGLETFFSKMFTKGKQNKTTEELLEFGIINIDKSSGPTSFGVSDFVKKSLGLKKTAHFGTLDPKVTGVLPVALSRACKLTGYFLGEDKEYVGIMQMHEEVSLKEIEKIIKKKFKGIIKQTPPVKSRVKRQEREREIKIFELLEQDGKDILFRVTCQGGTYIRKICDDLGKELGIGAHMLELRRIRAGIFKEEDKNYPIVNLYDFEKAAEEYKKGDDKLLREIIIPAEIVSEVYKVVKVKKEVVKNLWQGKPFFVKDVLSKPGVRKDEIVCVFAEDKFVGMYKIQQHPRAYPEIFRKEKFTRGKEIFAKPEFVFQPIGE